MFKQDIERTVGKVLNDNGYRERYLAKGCIYYIKRYSDKLAFYVRCTDNRHHDGAVSVEMFFTAIQLPDDRIVTFDVGVHIEILEVYFGITDKLMIAAGKKVVAVESNIGKVSSVILEELKQPYFPKKRNEVFKDILLIYDTINEDICLQEEFNSLKKEVCKCIKKNRTSEILPLCSEFIDRLPTDYFNVRNIEIDIDEIKDCLEEQIYAQCILDV
ncbi:MAG: hypothetical protein K2N51_09580 [Lachnospiraceae bacterium]|nr:hypothetical protein [Lachnospiraceae bacterium]